MLTVPWFVTTSIQRVVGDRPVVVATDTPPQQQQQQDQKQEQQQQQQQQDQKQEQQQVSQTQQNNVSEVATSQPEEPHPPVAEETLPARSIEPTSAPVTQAAAPSAVSEAVNGQDSPKISKKTVSLTPSISESKMGEAWAQNQVERFQFNFEKADKDKSGSLSFAEVYAVLKSNGFNGSETEAQFIFSHLDKNKDHKITKDEFTSAMKNLPRLSIKEFALRKAFLDLDKDASGFLTRTEIEDGITNNAGLDITTDKFSELLIYLCKEDKDKKVSYEEFLYVFGVEATAVELRRVFTVLDKDGSGLLSRDEILEAVRADFELKLAAEKISDLLILYSSKYKAADKSISYDEFVTVWLKQKEEKPKK